MSTTGVAEISSGRVMMTGSPSKGKSWANRFRRFLVTGFEGAGTTTFCNILFGYECLVTHARHRGSKHIPEPPFAACHDVDGFRGARSHACAIPLVFPQLSGNPLQARVQAVDVPGMQLPHGAESSKAFAKSLEQGCALLGGMVDHVFILVHCEQLRSHRVVAEDIREMVRTLREKLGPAAVLRCEVILTNHTTLAKQRALREDRMILDANYDVEMSRGGFDSFVASTPRSFQEKLRPLLEICTNKKAFCFSLSGDKESEGFKRRTLELARAHVMAKVGAALIVDDPAPLPITFDGIAYVGDLIDPRACFAVRFRKFIEATARLEEERAHAKAQQTTCAWLSSCCSSTYSDAVATETRLSKEIKESREKFDRVFKDWYNNFVGED